MLLSVHELGSWHTDLLCCLRVNALSFMGEWCRVRDIFVATLQCECFLTPAYSGMFIFVCGKTCGFLIQYGWYENKLLKIFKVSDQVI